MDEMIQERLSHDAYFMALARMASSRSTCPRRSVGAVLIREKRVISTGYNGSPPGFRQCDVDGCLMVEGHCINTVHAEQNALLRSREQGDTIYCTDAPCLMCLKSCLSHNSGMKIVYWRDYRDDLRDAFLAHHGIQIYRIKEEDVTSMLRLIR